MTISPELLELRARLEAAGMIVVQEPDHLNVRLPFFSSVHVRLDGGRLRTDAFFGLAPRVRGTTIKLGALLAACLALVTRSSANLVVGMTAVTALAGAYDIIRWTITEQTITRITLLHALMAASQSPAQPQPQLTGGIPDFAARARAKAEAERR